MPRPELCARLEDPSYQLVVLTAPAGYGKTATLASWADEYGGGVAWLSCDRADAEPTRFMSGLLGAISATWPGVADDALVLLERRGADTYDAAIAVANDLASTDRAGVIVVDDLHLAAPSPRLLLAFIDALPDHISLVLGSRSGLPMSLARLRLRGGLLELGSADLRFTPEELAQFLDLQDVALSCGDVDRLHHLTEGWPAGAQLAALALRRGADSEQFFEAFSTTDRAVSDFLLSEVLDNLPADLVSFLVDTSVLDEFDVSLCAAVSETTEAAGHLDRLIADNLFVVILDERTGWYRYHHLFGAFLRARLASLGESRWRATHDRASRALEARGDIVGALSQAMATNDVERAGQTLRAVVGRDLNMMGGNDVIVRALRLWLHEFGTTLIATDPRWVLELLIGLIAVSGPDDAEWWLHRLRAAHPLDDGELTGLIEGAWSEHHLYRGQAGSALPHAHAALEAVGAPHGAGLVSLAFTIVARAHLQAGEIAPARAVLDHAAAHPVGNRVADEVRNPGLLAWVAALDGDLDRAEALVADVVHWADELELGPCEPGRIFAGLALVEVLTERNELIAASSALDDVHVAGENSDRPPFRSAIALQRAKLLRTSGDQAGAEASLSQAALVLRDPDAAARSVFAREAVHQALRFDPTTAAARIAGLDHDDVETQVLRARVTLIEHDHAEVARLLDDVAPAATRRQTVERGVLLALATLDRDVDRANVHLHEALIAGRPARMIRGIIDQGEGVHKLLLSCMPEVGLEDYVEELIGAAGNLPAPLRTSAPRNLIEPLSAREITVLRYLCSRLTYQEIASALYVSLNTLKSHVRSVYRKLGVASRAEAVEMGRRVQAI